jgi:hypothetical protein
MRPEQLIRDLKETARGWKFDMASIGFPAPVRKGRIIRDPKHLGKGWVGFNFAKALGVPIHLINDAAMQALGSYRGGRMLFLGLGTGLGSALVWAKTLMCPRAWRPAVFANPTSSRIISVFPVWNCLARKNGNGKVMYAVTQLKKSFIADYVVLGGGLVHRFGRLPKGIEHGRNENAFLGGIRLWEVEKRQRAENGA